MHKLQITVSVRRCVPGGGEPQVESRIFEALASGLDEMVAWLRERGVDAAVMEGTGICWLAPFEALEAAGISARLVNARQVKQLKSRKTDVADSVWLARVRQFGLATASHVPPKAFREMRVLTRYRRTLIGQRSRVRNCGQKALNRSGARVGGVLSDVFGTNGQRILHGQARGLYHEAILAENGPDLDAFASAERLAAWAGLWPGHGPPQHLAAEHIEHDGQVQEPRPVATSAPSWPPRTSCYACSTSCCATPGHTMIPRPITKNSWSDATPRAGSACFIATA